MALHQLADVTITPTPTALSATSIRASSIILQGISLSGTCRIGDSAVTTSSGLALFTTKDTVYLNPLGNTRSLDLSTIFVVGTQSDKLGVSYNTE